MPLGVGTSLRIDLWMGEERLLPGAIVRTRDPGAGMGIEFTGRPEGTKKRFQADLDKLDPGISLGPKESRSIG